MASTEISRKELAAKAAGNVFGALPKKMSSPFTVSASPAWRGVEGDIWLIEENEQTAIVKHYNEDTKFYVDKKAAILAAIEAGKLRLGPSVIDSWADKGIIAFEALAKPCVAG